MGIKRGAEPLLGSGLRVRRIQNPRDVGKSLIIIDDAFRAAEIVTDEAADQLDECLPVPQNARFQHLGEKGIRKPNRENGRHPTGQEDRDNNVEALEPVVPAFLHKVSKWHTAGWPR